MSSSAGDGKGQQHALRPTLSEIFQTEHDDEQAAMPTPPYSRTTFSDRQAAHILPSQNSPAYKSTATLGTHPEADELEGLPQPAAVGDHKPSVRYSADVKAPPSPDHHGIPLPQSESVASSVANTDDEDEDDDFDWSGDEDLLDEEKKFEQRMSSANRRGRRWGFRRILSLLFGSFIGSIVTAGLLVTPPLILKYYWYQPHPTPQRLYILQNIEAWLFWAAAQVIISWVLALMVDIVPAVVTGTISIVWGHVSEYIKTRIELYTAIKNNIKPLLYAASGWASWAIIFGSIYQLYDPDNEPASLASYTPRVYQVIELIFFLALVFSVQRIVFHFIAFTFHRVAFKERAEEVNEALRVIEILRNYKPKPRASRARSTPMLGGLFGFGQMPGGSPRNRSRDAGGSRPGSPALSSGARTPAEWHNDATLVNARAKGKQPVHSHSPLVSERMPLSPSRGDFAHQQSRDDDDAPSPQHQYPPAPAPASTRAPGADLDAAGDAALRAARALGRTVLLDTRGLRGGGKGGADKGAWDVTSAAAAKRLARVLYQSLRAREQRRNYLVPADFEPAFETPEAARAAFRVFDADDNGDLSRAELKTKLLKVYKERRSLSRSMRDVGVALGTLNKILMVLALVVLFFIALSVFRIDVTKSLTSLYTLGIAFSFVFKNSAGSAFDSIMFLFVTHPFDTGDRCFIDDDVLVVKQMGLFATVFTRSDGTETYYFNSQLFSKFIVNCRRSAKTAEGMTIQVAWRTPLAKLDELAACMNQWLETEPNRWFTPPTSVTLSKIEHQRFLECTIGIGHNGNWQDWGLRMARRTAFHAAVNYYCNQLGITLAEAPLPLVWADEQGRFDGDGVTDELAEPAPPGSPAAYKTTSGAGAAEDDAELFTSALGFAPPESQRADLRLRARKKKSRKAGLGFMAADMS